MTRPSSSIGTRPISRRSRASALRRTITRLRRRPDNWSRVARSHGSRRAKSGGSKQRLRLERELERNTFPSGLNRELASDYHGFVGHLGLVAAIEAGAAGRPLSEQTWARLCRMVDAAYAMVDERLRPPRQGDSDDGRALVLDGADDSSWSALLASGAGIFEPLSWWPPPAPASVGSTMLTSLAAGPKRIIGRPARRVSHFAEAGLTILRTKPGDGPEIWCRCDGGPHGYLSIAAHAHADALSLELRYGGVDILADPGTYCYHGNPEWRAYFRSTLGHNTLELDGIDQSESGGPFLWLRHASTTVVDETVDERDGMQSWSAEHDGYTRLDTPARHHRRVCLDPSSRRVKIVDRVESASEHSYRIAFHLGPAVETDLRDNTARLQWCAAGASTCAELRLPAQLHWSVHRGETDPPLGWHSEGFGRRQPTNMLLGAGVCNSGQDLVSVLTFQR